MFSIQTLILSVLASAAAAVEESKETHILGLGQQVD